MNMRIINGILLAISMIHGSAYCSTTVWTNGAGDNDWAASANWSNGLPQSGDLALINPGTIGPVITEGVYGADGVNLGDSGTGQVTMEIEGGTLNVQSWYVLGFGSQTNAVLNINGGFLNLVLSESDTYGDLIVGAHNGGSGTINIASGNIRARQLLVGWYSGSGTINLDGGMLELTQPANSIAITERGQINITKGTLLLSQDQTIACGEHIRLGRIKAYNGDGTILVDYNNLNPGKTTLTACFGRPQNYCNPLDVKAADVMINKFGDTYYCYATACQSYPNSTNGKGCPIFSSKDLINWQYRGLTFNDSSSIWGQYWFWGPEVYQKNGVYYLYSPCFKTINGADVGRIAVSTSSSPVGPFTEVKAPMFNWNTDQDVIDVGGFFDEDGSMYMYFTVTSHPISGGYGNVIYMAKINSDMKTLATSPQLCIQPSQSWEASINEGACVIKHNGTYYLVYSGDDYRQNYAIGYATSSSPYGPWTKYAGNPILSGSSSIKKTGCPSFIRSPDNTELLMVYHSELVPPGDIRQLNISRVHFESNPGNPDKLVVENGASKTPQSYPSGAPFTRSAIPDEFEAGYVVFDIWKNIWGQTLTQYNVSQGKLVLALATGCAYQTGNDGSNVFLQLAPPGNWNITTKVTLDALQNFEAAFLTVWQDSDNYITLNTNYVNTKAFEVGVEQNGIYASTVISNPVGNSPYLQIRKTGQNIYQCYYSANGLQWNKIGSDISLSMQEIKVGLGAWLVYSSRTGITAAFDFFRIDRTTLKSDADGDQNVDWNDLDFIIADWLNRNCIIKNNADFNEDCSVNLSDFAMLAAEWAN